MPTNVIMPALGVTQQAGTLVKWLKAEGDRVAKGEPLMEVETDKATVEVEAPDSGILAQVTAKSGDQVPVGRRIACIVAPGETLPPNLVSAGDSPRAMYRQENQPASAAKKNSEKNLVAVTSTLPGSGRVLASPAARRVAKEKGLALTCLQGSGPEGSILMRDVWCALAEANRPAAAAANTRQIVPLTSMRRLVGERMTRSKRTAPHFYLSMDIDMREVISHRDDWKGADGQKASLNDFFLHACARALKDFPSLNASFTGNGIEFHGDINLGMAVALEEGLVVPVIRNADRLSLTELAAQSRRLVEKAQTKKLFPQDCEGGTFTVSNLGMLGVDSFTAIINPPQCAILAIGRVAERVVVDNSMFAIQPMVTATLSADHRVIDGAIGARFLREVKDRLERGPVDS